MPFTYLHDSVPIPSVFAYNHYPSVVQIEVRNGDFSRSSFSVENCFHYPAIFVIPDEFEIYSLYLCDELSWYFDGDCIESIDCFCIKAIFVI